MSALSIVFLMTACTGVFSNIFGQDNPALLVESERLYRLPLPAGRANFLMMQGVGGSFSHTGNQVWAFDWSMARGTPVLAARGGTVVGVRSEPGDRSLPIEKRRANYVRVDHGDGSVAVYAHLDTATARPGERLEPGDVIGLSGNTGYSTQPHLHFHVERSGVSVPVAFVDVRDPHGVPRAGKLYKGTWPGNSGSESRRGGY